MDGHDRSSRPGPLSPRQNGHIHRRRRRPKQLTPASGVVVDYLERNGRVQLRTRAREFQVVCRRVAIEAAPMNT